MLKRVIFAIMFLVLVVIISSTINNAFQLMVENTLAVEQVESSDLAVIGMRSMGKWKVFIYLTEVIIALGGLWLIIGKPIFKKIEEINKETT